VNHDDGYLPDFIICGAQRAGTTALFQYITQHPNLCGSFNKEVNYFNFNYEKEIAWYKNFFSHCNNNAIKGEASPSYMYFEDVPKRIFQITPEIKLIFILRHPVERAYSHYWHEVIMGREKLTFKEAINREETRINENIYNKTYYSYKDRGRYIDFIKKYKIYFPESRIHIIINRDLREDILLTLKNTLLFLNGDMDTTFQDWKTPPKRDTFGKAPKSVFIQRMIQRIPFRYVKSFFLILNNYFNSRPYPEISEESRSILLDYFYDYNKELEIHLNRKLEWWFK